MQKDTGAEFLQYPLAEDVANHFHGSEFGGLWTLQIKVGTATAAKPPYKKRFPKLLTLLTIEMMHKQTVVLNFVLQSLSLSGRLTPFGAKLSRT